MDPVAKQVCLMKPSRRFSVLELGLVSSKNFPIPSISMSSFQATKIMTKHMVVDHMVSGKRGGRYIWTSSIIWYSRSLGEQAPLYM